jgi:hypothetical protein
MITLDPPHMGLNDARAPMKVTMWNTWLVPAGDTRTHIVSWVAQVAAKAPGRKLKNVVLNCHGNSSYLQLGEGFDRRHTNLFKLWRGKVDKIWIRACLVARIQHAGATTTGDGNLFCSELARAAQCHVVAPTELQVESRGLVLPFGKIDTYEGLLVSYSPDGKIHWSHRYPSTWKSPTSGWHRNP